MRLLMNGLPLLGRQTGMGRYVSCLLQEFQHCPELDEIGVFDGKKIVRPEKFISVARSQFYGEWYELLRKTVGKSIPFGKVALRLFREFMFRNQTKGRQWTIYHETNYIAYAFPEATVTTICDLSYKRYPEFLSNDRLRWLKENLRQSIERSQAIITPSLFTCRELLETYPHIPKDRIFVVPLGVCTKEYDCNIDHSFVDNVCSLYRLPRKFILHVGTLEPRKNIQRLLFAFQSLPQDLQKEYPLVLIGSPGFNYFKIKPLLDELRKDRRLYELGYVSQHHLPAFMKAARVFCFPSVYEGFGLPPLEAASCGTPVLCSNTSSLPEVMGKSALYVNPFDSDEIREGLFRLLHDQNLRTALRREGLIRAQLFSWENCARNTIQVYRRAVETASSSKTPAHRICEHTPITGQVVAPVSARIPRGRPCSVR